ncbi:uncharacterized protein DNG_08436 [Cephalotrichum gorgonifer]|uniref:Myb-like domain-containing protein n=1 Tax=Cephalotrichum gorgonifer TaxID=2041049 RepID=A0AAE8N544_9PEZI|nr:uncharacterized protein DNG_08436 [Cephalotrichum gorgonifer]
MATQDGESSKDFTPTELAFIKAVFRHSKARMNADWDKVAEEVKVKDAKCAKERFRQISVKHAFGSAPDSSPQKASVDTIDSSPTKVTKKRAPRKKKANVKDDGATDGGSGVGLGGTGQVAESTIKAEGTSYEAKAEDDGENEGTI